MPAFSGPERRFADALGRLSHVNPFLPERIDAERDALGRDFDEVHAEWNLQPDQQYGHPNVDRLIERAERLARLVHQRLARGISCEADEAQLYNDLVLFFVFHRHRRALDEIIASGPGDASRRAAAKVYRAFVDDAHPLLAVAESLRHLTDDLPHAFACLFQVRRAYKNIFDFIIGISQPAIRLRAAVWQSIFTHDMRRYRRSLYRQLGDYTSLVTGPSGTGKELIARAIGLSRYIPFDSKTGLPPEHFAGSFFAINLSAFSPTLIESELFGHRRGSFTGAVADRAGWFELCPELGAVFLDEIGEVEPAIQVKLLRVLQTREFSKLGETQTQRFQGKLIAATNRDLASEIQRGRFREDLYYRLCSDVIQVPTLSERLADAPDELSHLVQHLVYRIVGDDAEAVVEEVLTTIARDLGPHYAWPGNVRELEQCVRNVVVRKEYRPRLLATAPRGEAIPVESDARASIPADAHREVMAAIRNGSITADELLRYYCTLTYAQCGSYETAAARLKLDRRTVKAKIDLQLLARLR